MISVKRKSEAALFGSDIMDKAIEDVALDRFLDGNPKIINDEVAYLELISRLRKRRALDIQKELKGKAKGKGKTNGEDEEG